MEDEVADHDVEDARVERQRRGARLLERDPLGYALGGGVLLARGLGELPTASPAVDADDMGDRMGPRDGDGESAVAASDVENFAAALPVQATENEPSNLGLDVASARGEFPPGVGKVAGAGEDEDGGRDKPERKRAKTAQDDGQDEGNEDEFHRNPVGVPRLGGDGLGHGRRPLAAALGRPAASAGFRRR